MKDIQLRQLFRNTEKYADQEVIIRGWIRTNRSSNKFGFVEINDGSFFKSVQVVYCLLYTSPSPRDRQKSRMPSSA